MGRPGLSAAAPDRGVDWLVRLASRANCPSISAFRSSVRSALRHAGCGATVLGVLTGYVLSMRNLFDPTIHALRTIPGLAWTPMFILWFGIGETSKVALIALVTFFPVYLNTMAGVAGVDRKLIEVGRVNRLSGPRLMWTILLPASLPSFIGCGNRWACLDRGGRAELMGASRESASCCSTASDRSPRRSTPA